MIPRCWIIKKQRRIDPGVELSAKAGDVDSRRIEYGYLPKLGEGEDEGPPNNIPTSPLRS